MASTLAPGPWIVVWALSVKAGRAEPSVIVFAELNTDVSNAIVSVPAVLLA
jgi:hypothetical protein